MGSAPEADSDNPTYEGQDLAYVLSSKYRVEVIDALGSGPATPTTISEEQSVPIAHTSRALGRLSDRGLVELIVPESTQKGRVYSLTSRAERLLEEQGDIIQRHRESSEQ